MALEPRADGSLRFAMIAPDGTRLPLVGKFREVVESERITFSIGPERSAELPEGPLPPQQVQEVIFEDVGDKTRLTIRTILESTADFDFVREVSHSEGSFSSLERLDALVIAV